MSPGPIDVDGDGTADITFVSNQGAGYLDASPPYGLTGNIGGIPGIGAAWARGTSILVPGDGVGRNEVITGHRGVILSSDDNWSKVHFSSGEGWVRWRFGATRNVVTPLVFVREASGVDLSAAGAAQLVAAPVWFDATDLAQANYTTVAAWGGQTAAQTPTFLTHQTPNGSPAVLFDGTDRMGDNILVPASSAQDFIIAAVIKPDSTGAYHNLVDDDAQTSPMLWVRPDLLYEFNFGANSTSVGAGTRGWDILIADSRLNQIYLNSPTANASGRDATAHATIRGFDFFHRDGAQTFRGKVAELRIYNDRAGFGGDFAALHNELHDKWIGPEHTPIVVNTLADEFDTPSGAAISLREALRDAEAVGGADDITFAPALSGGTISLTSQIAITDLDGVTVEASTLPAGLAIDDGTATSYRLFYVNTGSRLTLRGLTLANGGGGSLAGRGGAIYNDNGTLTMERCTLSGNSCQDYGGAILSYTASITGPNTSSTTLMQCTLVGNTSYSGGGGAIHNDNGRTTLTHCTVSGNTAPPGAGGGVASYGDTLTETVVRNCIIAGNTNSDVDFVGSSANSFASSGGNLIGTGNATGDFNQIGDVTGQTVATIKLAPPGNYGGPTPTMALLPGSPARNAVTSSFATDQRGFPIVGVADIGAYEAGTFTVYNAWIHETLPVAATPAQHASTFDYDGDGYNNGLEWTLRSDPAKAFLVVNTLVDEFNTPSGANLSLREAVRDAAASGGADYILFAPALSGATLSLSSQMVVNDLELVTIDASTLPAGLTIDDGAATGYRLFFVNNGGTLTLRALTLAHGGTSAIAGGAIHNNYGKLTLERCTLSGNIGSTGGAIYSATILGNLPLTSSTILTHCTLTGNAASQRGGAVYIDEGSTTLTHCTVSDNSAPASSGGGVASRGDTLTATVVRNSIIAGNTNSDVDFVVSAANSFASNGGNLIGTGNATGDFNQPGDLTGQTVAQIKLGALAGNGGPTQTMALLPGSPALDAAAVIAGLTTDQRGFPRNRDGNATAGALPDMGAYEAQAEPFSLGFNFVGGRGGNPGGSLAPADRAGVPMFAQGNWNNLTTDYDGSGNGSAPNAASRTDAAGTPVPGLSLWWDAANPHSIDPAAPTTPNTQLMNGYLDSNGDTATSANLNEDKNQPYFAIAGLPAALTTGGYRVIVYADGDNNPEIRTAKYWLQSNRHATPGNVAGETDLTTQRFLKDSANFSGTYTPVPATAVSDATAVNGNYLVFGIQTEPGFILRAQESSAPVNLRAPINAVQVVRNEIIVVTTPSDENDLNGTPLGAGNTGISLREALRDAPEGAGILFDSTLNGGSITLGSQITLAKNVTIDARGLPGGLTIHDGVADAYRLFKVSNDANVTLRDLTLANGGGSNFSLLNNNDGGAIANQDGGKLTLEGCTLTGNQGKFGGAVYNYTSSGSTALLHCTLVGNTARNGGGAVFNNFGLTTLTHCTVTGNTAPFGFGSGVVSVGWTYAGTVVSHCIIAGNTSRDVDLAASPINTFTSLGRNLIGTGDGAGDFNQPGDSINHSAATIQLAPPGDYGGPTQTMALLPGSPARNAAIGSPSTRDQRGFPIVGTPDIGAYEAGTFNSYTTWIYESLPANATVPQHATTVDFDGDGATNAEEWAALTDPASIVSVFRATATKFGGNLILTFPTATGKTYTLWRNDLLTDTWINTGLSGVFGDGSSKTFTVPTPGIGIYRRYYRVQAGP